MVFVLDTSSQKEGMKRETMITALSFNCCYGFKFILKGFDNINGSRGPFPGLRVVHLVTGYLSSQNQACDQL